MSKKILIPIILAAVLLVLVGFTMHSMGGSPKPSQPNLLKLQEVIRYVNENYFEEVNNDKLVEDAIEGMLKGLDPHTFYIPAKEMQKVNEDMRGNFEGIGVQFSILEDTIYVVSPIIGGPSEKLGILAGDKIVKIETENVAGIGVTNNDVFNRLRGEKGTVVKVSIKRNGVKRLLDFDIVRDKIPIHSVDYSYMVDSETGYIRVSRFAETTFREFMDHLNKLKGMGMQNLILDLRNNPGGYLDKAKMMADVFLDANKLIVYTEGRTAGSSHRYETSPMISGFEEGGVVVLINQGSASASEIVSGAVQDWDRGIVVGRRSFGKGLVQQQYQLNDGAAIRVVVSRYFTPSGRCIQKPYDNTKDYELEILDRYESGELFDKNKIKLADSLKFTTQSGRVVYGGGGIMPDVFVPTDTSGSSPYLTDLISKNIFRTFTFQYLERHTELKTAYKDGFDFAKRFSVSDAILKEFFAYATEKGVPYVEEEYRTSQKYVDNNLKAIIGRTAYNEDAYYPVTLSVDPEFQKAYEMVPASRKLAKSGKYKD